MFWGTFFPNLKGMKEVKSPPLSMYRTYHPSVGAYLEASLKPGETVVCDGKVSHPGRSDNVDQFEYLKKVVPKERWGDVKLTIPAPEWYHFRLAEGEGYPKDVYKNDSEFFKDLAVAYHVELDLLYKAGCRNLQIDDPSLACA